MRVGIEIHARIKSETKLFSQASALVRDAATGRPPVPNSQVSFMDSALPGAMPKLNPACVKQAVLTGLAVEGNIQPLSVFERKHYFYCDQPLGFQITQQSSPVVRGGVVRLPNSKVDVRLTRIQLEQDTGKSMHFDTCSLVDFNRAGCGLMEIVSMPDMTSAKQAGEYVRTVQKLLQMLGTCDGHMEDGSLRADVNVSTAKSWPHRVEIKNLNSIRSVERAIAYEEQRLNQTPISSNETRSFDVKSGTTQPLRDKESAIDYRFMIEPDLPPLEISPELVQECHENMRELPKQQRARVERQYPGLKPQDVDLFLANPALLAYFELVVADQPLAPVQVANLLNNNLLGSIRARGDEDEHGDDPAACVPPAEFQRLLRHAFASKATSLQVKDWIGKLARSGGDDDSWLKESCGAGTAGATGVDDQAIEELCEQAMRANSAQLNKFLSGKLMLSKFFFGQVMIKLKSERVDVDHVRAVVDRVLAKEKSKQP